MNGPRLRCLAAVDRMRGMCGRGDTVTLRSARGLELAAMHVETDREACIAMFAAGLLPGDYIWGTAPHEYVLPVIEPPAKEAPPPDPRVDAYMNQVLLAPAAFVVRDAGETDTEFRHRVKSMRTPGMVPEVVRPVNLEEARELHAAMGPSKAFEATSQEMGQFYRQLWQAELERIVAATPFEHFAVIEGPALGTGEVKSVAGPLNSWHLRLAYLPAKLYDQAVAGELLGPGEWRIFPVMKAPDISFTHRPLAGMAHQET